MALYGPFLELNPSKKNSDWARQIVSQIRQESYRQLYSEINAIELRKIINSIDELHYVKKMFKNPEKLVEAGFEFIPISIMEKVKNILLGEKLQSELKAYVNAKDPSMDVMRREDKNLLKNKRVIENQVNQLKQQLGLPEEEITNDDFNGNYDQFQQMGMNDEDESEIEHFFETYYLLDDEALLQKFVNHVFSVNALDEYTFDWLVDILSIKTVACQQFVNKLNGCIQIRRLNPWEVFIVKGQNKINQKGDVAIGYYELVTVSEFLKRVGPSFDVYTQFKILFDAVNYNNRIGGINITGVMDPFGVTGLFGNTTGNVVNFNTLLNYQVKLGYMEWKSVDQKTLKEFTNRAGNKKVYEILDNDSSKEYREYKFQPKERTYKCYFLETSTMDQYVFEHGLLHHQEVNGIEDEYSSFSIKYIQLDGKSVAEISKPYIKMCQEAFHKLKFIIRRSKPDGREINAESLRDLSKILTGKEGTPSSIMETFHLIDESINELVVPMKGMDGNPIATSGSINHDIKRPIDSKFKSFAEIIQWAVSAIKADIGITDLRNADEPKTNDVNKLEQTALQKSSNATFYMDYMLDYLYKNQATSTISFLQGIVIFKDPLAYEYAKGVIGEEGCKKLEALPRVALHRLDIFVVSFANFQNRLQVMKDTQIAFEKGLIDYSVKVLIDSIDDFRKAQRILAFKENAKKKELQQQEMQKQKAMSDLEAQKHKNAIEQIDRRGGWELKKANAMAQGYIDASEVNAKVKLGVEDKKGENEKDKKVLEDELAKQKETYTG